MIMIDDNICLIGSANVNDRSMIGHRDSEIGVEIYFFHLYKFQKISKIVVEDSRKIESKMDGKKYKAAEFIYNLRVNLFKEHFALDDNECKDPLDNEMWELILERTKVIFF